MSTILPMPTYVYECRECGGVIEAEQRISEEPLRDCACGAEGALKRVMQPTAVMFKGSGFYVNDSGAKPEAKPAESAPASVG